MRAQPAAKAQVDAHLASLGELVGAQHLECAPTWSAAGGAASRFLQCVCQPCVYRRILLAAGAMHCPVWHVIHTGKQQPPSVAALLPPLCTFVARGCWQLMRAALPLLRLFLWAGAGPGG